MISITDRILPGESIGSIKIGSKGQRYIDYAYSNNIDIEFNEFADHATEVRVYGGKLNFVMDSSTGVVLNVSCKSGYKGATNNGIRPGLTVEEINSASDHLNCIHGFLMLDRGLQIGFSLPSDFEELDYPDELPTKLILDHLYIMKENWWKS